MTGKFENLFKVEMKHGTYIVQFRDMQVNLVGTKDSYPVLLGDYICGMEYGKITCHANGTTGIGGFRMDEIQSITPLKRGVKKYRKIFEDTLTQSKALV